MNLPKSTHASREKKSYPPFSRKLPPVETDLGESHVSGRGIGASDVSGSAGSSQGNRAKTKPPRQIPGQRLVQAYGGRRALALHHRRSEPETVTRGGVAAKLDIN